MCVFIQTCAAEQFGNHAGRFQRHQNQTLVAEAKIDLTAKWDRTQREVKKCEEEYYEQAIACYKKGVQKLLPKKDRRFSGVLLPTDNDLNTIVQEISVGRMRTNQSHGAHERAASALDKIEEGILKLIEHGQSQLSSHSSQDHRNARLLTRLKSAKRQAEQILNSSDDCFAQVTESWERNREVLNGDWETSGGISSRSSNFPKWRLIDGRGIAHGYIRCAIHSGKQDGEWKKVKDMAKPRQLVVRVYVIEGINLRAMDVGGSSDPYVIATLSGEKQLKQGGRDLHKTATLNPEFRQARMPVRLLFF
jgi:hypothetical protein